MRDGKRAARLPKLQALALAVQAVWGFSAWAAPEGAVVVAGQVAISQPMAGLTQIQASNGSIINWKQFSIGAGETTQFVQPSAASAVLNRVVGPDVSSLLGQLKANGQVFLINPNGIVIGNAARIDTNSFVASTLDIADADFLAGRLRFSTGSTSGRVRNEGLITAGPGGSIALIAPDIENTGIIRAPDGNILLAAGRKLEITSMDLDGVTFEIQAPTDSVLNLGKILAENGAVQAFAGSLRHSGEIRASRLTQDGEGNIVLAGTSNVTLTADSITSASGASGGSIVVQSTGGVTRVAGQLEASGSDGTGGAIHVLGERVALESGASIDVSGSAGGGQILVGGDYQGNNPDVQNALRVAVGADVHLNADATEQGDGGRVIVWADENTRYYGHISARGGAQGGDGGFAEVSGKQNLEFAGSADLSAPNGLTGTLLLDPLDIIVSSTSGILSSVVDEFSDFSGNVVTVSPEHLAAVAANVTLQAERDIYIKDAIALTTPGAGLSITAGGAEFDAGTLYNNAGISTTGGDVTLRAQAVTGAGGISTAGGAVDILTSGSLNYYSDIDSGGGNVTLASQTGSVNYSVVDAGSGTINVTGTSIYGGNFSTLGSINLSANNSIYASVNAGVQVNATSTASWVDLYNTSSDPLRLGNLNGHTGLYLESSSGMLQAAGGLLTSPYIALYNYGSTTSSGTLADPLRIAAPSPLVKPQVAAYDLAAPVHLDFAPGTTIGGLYLDGTVAGLGASTVTGSANLSSLNLSAGAGVLNVSALASAGMDYGFSLSVDDGAINAPVLTLPGTAVDLEANGAVSIGTMSGNSLYVDARGAVDIGSAETTGTSGINVYTNACNFYTYSGCSAISPITVGNLNAGALGSIGLTTEDNGDLTVTGSLTARSAYLSAGDVYYTSASPYYYSMPTANAINVASVSTTNGLTVYHRGEGDIQIDNLIAGGSVYVNAGRSYTVPSGSFPYYASERTQNNISIENAGPSQAGYYQVYNYGVGDISLTGDISRTSGGIWLSTQDGAISSSGDLLAQWGVGINSSGTNSSISLSNVTSTADWVQVTSGGALNVGDVASGSTESYDARVNLSAQGDLLFKSVSSISNGYYSNEGNVTLTSATGSVMASTDTFDLDITASGNVSITAANSVNGWIGNSSFTNPLDIKAGANSVVTLVAGRDIGAAGKAITVDTMGTIDVSTSGGQFHVAATDGTDEINVATVRLAASASGIGDGNAAVFTSANLDITANSDGSTISLGQLAQSAGTLDEFRFNASGSSALAFDGVELATETGANRLALIAGNGLAQSADNNIDAGGVTLAGGAGSVSVGAVTATGGTDHRIVISGLDISTYDLSGSSVSVTGRHLDLGGLTSTGLNRVTLSSAGLVPDAVTVSATGNVNIYGDVSSATSVNIATSGGNLMIEGDVTSSGVGRSNNSLNFVYAPYSFAAMSPDRVSLSATGDISTDGAVSSLRSTSVVAGGNISIPGSISGGTVGDFNSTLNNDAVTVTAGGAASLNVQSIVGGYNTTVSAETLNIPGGITGGSNNTWIAAGLFNTGNFQTAGTLTVNASGDYDSGSMSLTGSHVIVNASGDIRIGNDGPPALIAPMVTLRSFDGNVTADLSGTNNLTIQTGAGFNVFSDTWLSNLSITAQWDRATDSNGYTGSVGASLFSNNGSSETQSFNYGFDGPLYMNIGSSGSTAPWNLSYIDTAATAPVESYVALSANHAGSGNFTIDFGSETELDVSASLGATRLQLASYGDIRLDGVTTTGTGGRVDANSWGGDVNIDSLSMSGGALFTYAGDTLRLGNVSTGGGNVTASAVNDVLIDSIVTSGVSGGSVNITSQTGGIFMDGEAPTGIDTSIIGTTPSPGGGVTLTALNGSIGNESTPIELAYASALSLRARDNIVVEANNSTLSSLNVDVNAGGSGSISIAGSHNFSDLTLARVDTGTNLSLSGLAPTTTGAFTLTVRDGGIKVDDDISNVTDLTLDAKAGNIEILAPSLDARSVSASGAIRLLASNDVLIAAGTDSTDESVGISGGTIHIAAGRDLLIAAGEGSVSVTSTNAATEQVLSAGRDFRLSGGTGLDAYASVDLSGTTTWQTLTAGRDWTIEGGSGTGAYASIAAPNTFQQRLTVTGNALLHGGTGAGAYASMTHGYTPGGGSQTTNIAGNLSILGGDAATGQGDGAYAEMRGKTQTLHVGGDVLVAGGTAADNSALISSSLNQILGSTNTGNGPITNSVTLQGGSGEGAFARIASGGTQSVQAGLDGLSATGDIKVSGGSGTDAFAEITAASSQTIGSQTTFCFFYTCRSTDDILVAGGQGDGAYGSIRAGGSQTILAGGNISVTGSSGDGAYAEIVSTAGAQTIGSSSTSNIDPTGSILVQAGSGGIARILAANNQTIMAGGNLSVIGGSGNDMTASIETSGGFQTIGNTSLFSNDPIGSIIVAAGTATGSAAWIKAATGQTIDAGGAISLTGGAQTGSYAEIATTAGTQTIGNVNSTFSFDRTDSLTLTGGQAAGSYARIGTGGSQNIRSAGDIHLTGGSGDDAGALLEAGANQSVTGLGALIIQGGSGTTASGNESGIVQQLNGSQTIQITSDISLLGGATGSDTFIRKEGTANQTITTSTGSLLIQAPAGLPNSNGSVGISSGSGNQVINAASGTITVNNEAAQSAYLSSGGNQTITTRSMLVSLSSTAAPAPVAEVSAAGDQTITLNGDGMTAGTATLSVRNLSGTSGSLAAVSAGNDQNIQMHYDAAGLVQIGDVAGQGKAEITAQGDLTMVAGQVLIQGGATAAAQSALMAPDTMLISTLYGPVELKGGSDGPALIDPALLAIVSNGSVLIQAGTNATALAEIIAGDFNLAATIGDLSLFNSTTSTATASIFANTFNFVGPGAIYLNGGTITAVDAGMVTVPGWCNNCSTNLIGPFIINAYQPPPISYATLTTLDLLSLTDLFYGMYGYEFLDDGTLVFSTRRLSQCY